LANLKNICLFGQIYKPYAHFDPKRTLFIDDSESVLKTAANFGIQHIFSIHQPDSQTLQQRHSAFKMIEHFADILPINK
jgi:FMN phosphatase YigB (HAD superfamily)